MQVRTRLGAKVLRAVDDVLALDRYGAIEPVRGRCGGDVERLDRAVRVKLADRLHNARTWQYVPADHALLKAEQTRSLLVGAAQQAGLPAVAAELSALAEHMLASGPPGEPTVQPSGEEGAPGDDRRDDAAGRLLRRAVQALPVAERPRYAQEWAADLAVTHGTAARLQLTIGMLYSARVLRRDHHRARCAFPRPR